MVPLANIVPDIMKAKVMYHDNHQLISLLNDASNCQMRHVLADQDSKF